MEVHQVLHMNGGDDKSSYAQNSSHQVPNGLIEESGIPLNRGNIYITKTSPPIVHQAYLEQFANDFTSFLSIRSEEMVPHGHILLTIVGKGDDESDGASVSEFIGMALNDMVVEGYLEKEKVETFNVPHFLPSIEEVRDIIQKEGSFKIIMRIETFKLRTDASLSSDINGNVLDEYVKAKYVAKQLRAVYEPILANHFGDTVIDDDLFHRFAKKYAKNLQMGKGILNNMVISLCKELGN